MSATRFKTAWRALAARRRLAVGCVGALSLALSAGLSALRDPVPRYHDEFAYLLAADGFSQGHAAYPTHPLWPHFETFHVLMRPSYAAKYPPGQGLILAAGQAAFGRPIVGAWLGVALGCMAVTWMLQGTTRPRWALFGGLLAALHHGIQGGIDDTGSHYSWSQSFWGGGLAMFGGALVLGAAGRLVKRSRPGDAFVFGLGLSALAATRPLEGMIVGATSAAYILATTGVRRRSPPHVGAFLLGVLPGLAALLAYDGAVTGSPLTLPYRLYEAEYDPVPVFVLWVTPKPPPVYRHAVFADFFNGWCLDLWKRQRTLGGWASFHRERLRECWAFFVGPLIFPVLASLTGVGRDRFARLGVLTLGLTVGVHLTTMGLHPHYLAPATGCFFYLLVVGSRRLWLWKLGALRAGRLLLVFTLVGVVAELALVANRRSKAPRGWEYARAGIATSLTSRPGRHLAVVRYAPGHNVHEEWVYNAADIDAAPLIWARELDPTAMRRLFAHDPSRRVWLVEADARPPVFRGYSPPP